MTKVLLTESYLENIADAIRAKNGTQDTYTPGEMSEAINNIPSVTPETTYSWEPLGYTEAPDNSLDLYKMSCDLKKEWEENDWGHSDKWAKRGGSSVLTFIYQTLSSDYKNYSSINYFPIVDTSALTNMASFFAWTNIKYCPPLDLSNTTTLEYFCKSAGQLTRADLNNRNSNKLTNLTYAFDGCSSLTAVNFDNFNTSNVTNMSYMFQNCSKLQRIDLSSLDTGNVTNMKNMFSGCSILTNITFGNNWDTSKVTNMAYMFDGLNNGLTIDLSSWDLGSVTTMDYMFKVNSAATLNATFGTKNLPNLTSAIGMFAGHYGTNNKIFDLSGWTVPNITTMQMMFSSCDKAELIDIRGFSFDNLTTQGAYDVFMYVPTSCTIVVKDEDAKTFAKSKWGASRNFVTAAEYEASQAGE